TGGEDTKAQSDLANALAAIQAVQTPTTSQLQLSPLSQYYDTGNLNPATTQAAETGPSAFNNENLSQVPIGVMQQALAQEGQIANAQGMTPQEKASIAQAEESMNENVAGQRGAIAQQFAAMGVPQALISAALENGTVGQDAQQAYENSLQAQGQAAQQGLTALQNEGTLANTMYNTQANQANTIAAAQNALNQFNAANTQQANLANQANQQAVNTYNAQTAQNVANQNVQGQQGVQYQNQIEAPQESAQLALQKAAAEAGVSENQASNAMQQGQQQAGLIGGLIGAGATVGGDYALGSALSPAHAASTGVAGSLNAGGAGGPLDLPTVPTPYSRGGEVFQTIPATNFKSGGPVPGIPQVQGNSPKNDTVPAMLSPGEVVLPRTVVQNPKTLGNFLASKAPVMANHMTAHPSDIAAIARALSLMREGHA
ncbi:MAG: hypothetical protein KGL39_46895, partial [Patescibacteria group bacterium]|nr:hypothetical protein [Patescibacteria group bacterium]